MTKKSKSDKPWLEAFMTNAETALDTLSDNELTRSIPVVGTAFKFVKGLDEIKASTLMRKLELFISEPGMRSEEVARDWTARIQSSPEETKRVGETIFLAVDKTIDTRKPAIFAKVFLSYLRDNISASDLLRIVSAVDLAFIEDLELIQATSNPTSAHLQNLFSTGLVTIKHQAVYGGFDSMDIKLNEYGQKLRKILQAEA